MSAVPLSILTPTGHSRSCLVQCIRQVEEQTLAGIEHVVASDGPNPNIEALCAHYRVRYVALPARRGDAGRPALSAALAAATGEYVAFWYDGHLYPIDAAERLYRAAVGYDLGVVEIDYWHGVECRFLRLPRQWDGTIRPGNIDAANCCVRREFIRQSGLDPATVAPGKVDADGRFWATLQQKGARMNFVPGPVLSYISGWQGVR